MPARYNPKFDLLSKTCIKINNRTKTETSIRFPPTLTSINMLFVCVCVFNPYFIHCKKNNKRQFASWLTCMPINIRKVTKKVETRRKGRRRNRIGVRAKRKKRTLF